MSFEIQLVSCWKAALKSEFQRDYMGNLTTFLLERQREGAQIYPEVSEYFAALNACPLGAVKVVLLGQDPYHGPGQAHGLCFSVRPGVPLPPSLNNIFKELSQDMGYPIPAQGCLTPWASEGVLLLNSVLTVERGLPGSHAGKGWEKFTDRVISILSEDTMPKVFLLWGAYAQKKGQHIDRSRHLVLESPHPSPLSSYRGFFGSRPFSQANAFLKAQGRGPVHWDLSGLEVKADGVDASGRVGNV